MDNRLTLGIDTSCYTTSVACASSEGIVFEQRTMLSVPLGSRGLRQSEGVFQHIRNLPPLVNALFSAVDSNLVTMVAVSARPTGETDSYMPVFLAGRTVASAIAAAKGVPLYETNHQMGHVRAALYQNDSLRKAPRLLALHLSGGTTDILDVRMQDGCVGGVVCLGGSDDLHAGQFVDRVGVRLGLPFPSGQSLERLARQAEKRDIRLPSTVRGLHCSFSGQESQALRLWNDGGKNEEIAFAVYDCLARTIAKLIQNGMAQIPHAPVLLSGGVSGSLLLRELLEKRLGEKIYYAPHGLSGDNAAGVALLAMDRFTEASCKTP